MVKINAKLGDKSEHKGLIPDEWDEKNIRRLIEMWDKAHPRGRYQYMKDSKDERKLYIEYLNIHDHIEYMKKVIKQDRKLSKVMRKGYDDPITLTTSLPPSFATELRKAYPQLLTDKKQTAWFLRKFPEFKL